MLRPLRGENQSGLQGIECDPAFFTPRRGIHRIAQGRASGEAAKRRPGLIGPRLATLGSGATFSGAAKREQLGAKKKLLPDQIFNGPGYA